MAAVRRSLKLSAIFLCLCALVMIVYLSELPVLNASAQSPAAFADQIEFFEKQVRPILANNCAKCHNAKVKIAELDLTTAEGFQRGGESGALIDRSNPAESRLLKVVSYQEKLKMPPTGKMKDEELAVLTAWVKMGASWPPLPNAAPPAEGTTEAKPADKTTTREFTQSEKTFWAFQPVSNPAPPKVKNAAWVKSPIDAFVLRKLEEKGLAPALPADKLMLLRRATYDLIGLPPSESEIKEFLADSSPDAFKKVVERLLASPRYGEKLGRNWLDVARYADSTGNDEDHRYPHAWRYRDYVIEAFNKDLPYDQFVREQIAGDLLPPANSEGVNRRGIIATGFLALGPKAIAQQDKKKMLYDVYDEQVDVTTKAFLGLTVACARCHNHKFDPILTKDYYSMTGIFASTRSFGAPYEFVSESLTKPLVPKAEYDVYLEKKKAHQAQLKRRQLELSEIVDRAQTKLLSENGSRLAEFMIAAREVYHDKTEVKAVAAKWNLPEDILKRWVDYLKPGKVRQHLLEWQNAQPETLKDVAQRYQQRFSERSVEWNGKVEPWRVKYHKAIQANNELPEKPAFEAGHDRFFHEVYFGKNAPLAPSQDDQTKFPPADWERLAQLKKELDELKKQGPAEPEMACAVEDGEIVKQKVFIRGDHHSEGEDAPKSYPSILAPHTTQPTISSGSGRMQLAEWLVQPEHPLTARVMANRVWQWHFGEGIVRTPDNFGKMGERPTHPELLDYLARRFVSGNWSVKNLHRLIMLSSAYQMSSQPSEQNFTADQENRFLSRFNRRRLSVEEMRDGLMAIDGSLDLTMGGSLQAGVGTDGENDGKRLSMNPEKLTRRTVYLPLRRANLPTLLNLFDFGDATTASGKRQLTNVATQALFWMNSDFLTDRTKKMAQSLLDQKEASDAERVKTAYLRILIREPNEDEIAQTLNFIAAFKQKYGKQDADAWQSFCRVLAASNDFIYVD